MSLVEYKGDFYRLLHPRPVALIITICPNGRANAMPMSWFTPVSEDPPLIAAAISRENYTNECLRYCQEATLNVPGVEHVDLVFRLGTVSGRNVDKIGEFKLRLIESDVVKVPSWADAIAVIEVKVKGHYEVGESTLFILEVLKCKVKEGVANEWGFIIERVSPLLHGAGKAFFKVDSRRIFAKGR